jgi:hypothetical protein
LVFSIRPEADDTCDTGSAAIGIYPAGTGIGAARRKLVESGLELSPAL